MDKLKNFFRENYKPVIMPTVVLFVISAVIALALAGANAITAPTIARLEKEAQDKAMRKLIKAENYTEKSIKSDGEKIEYFVAEENGEVKGYIFTFAEKGYGGDVKVMAAISSDGKVASVDILDASNETPGLGQNVKKEGFFSQFKGKSGKVSVVKNGADQDAGEVDAVTGATISSKAVTKAVNRALSTYKEISERSGGAK